MPLGPITLVRDYYDRNLNDFNRYEIGRRNGEDEEALIKDQKFRESSVSGL
jgi:hypothetical protein